MTIEFKEGICRLRDKDGEVVLADADFISFLNECTHLLGMSLTAKLWEQALPGEY